MGIEFTYKCSHCGADISKNVEEIPETVVCDACGEETVVQTETFYSGEVFAGEF